MVLSIKGSTTVVVPIEEDSQVGHARRVAQGMASKLGFDEADAGRVALAATELATNLLKHAGHGELHLRAIPAEPGFAMELISIDRGPGFDPSECLADGFSTGGTPGNGLGALVRQAQLFDVFSDARGSVVLVHLYARHTSALPLRFGVSQHSLNADPSCGDVWHLAFDGQRVSALVIDGIGHGEDAEQASLAGAAVFASDPFSDPAVQMLQMHQAMMGTRGGAAALVLSDLSSGVLRFTGVGNIGARLLTRETSRGLASHPGIVGSRFRKAQVFDYPITENQLLMLYSDGLQTRWDLRDYPGLAFRHPALIAAVLHRDFCRGRDDVTVLVIALEVSGD